MQLEKRGPMAVSSPSNSYLFDTVADTTSNSNSVTLKGFTIHREDVVDSKVLEGEDGIVTVSTLHVSTLAHSQNSLHRSISEVIDKNTEEGRNEEWDPHRQWHDSGMFMEDEEFVDTIKGFSTVRKEHTMFTDTNL
ncbi:usherin [Alosa alosa]|uniref:usherin n=1 Tax=Alosa sapidissima TaxID=34773 RepID=UPI001C0A2B0D|nr:usherin [Alosa sapidissima]XP_048106735.1 usherin [Alosa alosa]